MKGPKSPVVWEHRVEEGRLIHFHRSPTTSRPITMATQKNAMQIAIQGFPLCNKAKKGFPISSATVCCACASA